MPFVVEPDRPGQFPQAPDNAGQHGRNERPGAGKPRNPEWRGKGPRRYFQNQSSRKIWAM